MIPPSGAIHIFTLSDGPALEAEALAPRLLPALPAVPEDLSFATEEITGWSPDITEAGPLIVVQARAFRKAIPAALLKRLVSDEVAARRAGDHPRSDTASVRTEIHADLLASALPTIRETTLALDPDTWQILVFGGSEKAAGILARSLARVLTDPATPAAIRNAEPWDLHAVLAALRPDAHLPGAMPPRFGRWLARIASETPFITLPIPGGTAQFMAALRSSIAFKSTAGGASSTDRHTTEAMIRTMDAGSFLATGAEVQSLDLEIEDADGMTWEVTLSSDAKILRQRLIFPQADEDADAVAEAFLRATAATRLCELIRLLIEAFDGTELQSWLDTEPQRQLWPGQSSAPATFAADRGGKPTPPAAPLFAGDH